MLLNWKWFAFLRHASLSPFPGPLESLLLPMGGVFFKSTDTTTVMGPLPRLVLWELGASWRRQWHPTPALLLGKAHGWRSLVGCSPWVAKSQTRLGNFSFTFHFHALEKDMATHSSVLAWRIPGMGESGGLLSMGSHRVGHDWSDLAAAAAADNVLST